MTISVCVSSVHSARVHAADEHFSARIMADHIYLVQGPAGNTLVAVDEDGLILIEGVPARHAKEYLNFVRKTTGEKRIKVLVNTHWHPESAGLNAALAGSDTRIIAHANTKQWLGATIRKRGDEILHEAVPAKYLPNTVFYDTYSIPFRGGEIELGYLLQAHTDGDIYAWFPQQDILYTGPALRSDGWSTVDEATNGFIGGLMDAFDTIDRIAKDTTQIVPASGAVLSKPEFAEHRTMYKGLMEKMVEMLRQSKGPDEVVMANPAAGLRPEWGDPSEFLDQGFRSFWGHLRNSRHVGVMP